MNAGTWPEPRRRHLGPLFQIIPEDAPILGWRYWKVVVVDGEARLASSWNGGKNPLAAGGVMVASCRWGFPLVPCGPEPSGHSSGMCFCGIFARPLLERPAMEYRQGLRACGIAKLWGRVNAYGNVLNAEFCLPLELEIRGPEPPVDEAVAIGDAYGIRTWAVADVEPFEASRFELAP